MAARLDDVDFTGICQCIPPVPDYTCKQGSQTWQHVFRIVVKLLPYLNSSAKWMHILKSSYCIHKWIYLLDIIFKSRLDERCEICLMYYLTEELLDMYPYRGYVNYVNYVSEFSRTPQYDYIQKNGDPHMFEPPDVQHFVNDVPFFLHTPLMWTEAVQAVNHMDEYKRVIYHLNICMLLPYIPKQDIIQKFNRDVVYYNNMKANLHIT